MPALFPLRRQGEKTAHIRKKISVYKKIYFRICGNFFLCARNFFVFRTASFFPAEGGEFSQVGKFIFQAWKIFFPRQENFPSFEGKRIALRKEKGFLPKGEKTACARKEIFVRTEINFLTYENIFSYVRKFIFLRTEILRLAHSAHSLGARREKNEASQGWTPCPAKDKKKGLAPQLRSQPFFV
nr:hypothetical protein [uncultured Porphyromonas sp.]